MAHQFHNGYWILLGGVAAGGCILSCLLDVGGVTPWAPPGASNEPLADSLAWVIEWLQIDFSLLVVASALVHQLSWILWAGALGVFFFWIPSTFMIAIRKRTAS